MKHFKACICAIIFILTYSFQSYSTTIDFSAYQPIIGPEIDTASEGAKELTVSTSSKFVCGDFNGDGYIDLADFPNMYDYLFHGYEYPTFQPEAGDVDSINGLNSNDLQALWYEILYESGNIYCSPFQDSILEVTSDTLKVLNSNVSPGEVSQEVILWLKLQEPMTSLTFPFKYNCSTSTITCDSISMYASIFDTAANVSTFTIDTTAHKVLINLMATKYPCNYIGAEEGVLVSLYFSLDASSLDTQYILIDTTGFPPSHVPVFSRGIMNPDCRSHAFLPTMIGLNNADLQNLDLELVKYYFTNVSSSWDTTDPAYVPKSDTEFVGAVVRNNSEYDATDVWLRIEKDGQVMPSGDILIGTLEGGETIFIDIPWPLPGPVTENVQFTFTVDPDELIPDIDRTNNSKSETVNIYYAVDEYGGPFDFREHAYNFANFKASKDQFDDAWNSVIDCVIPGLRYLLHVISNKAFIGQDSTGLCYGMSNSAALYMEDHLLSPMPSVTTFELEKPVATPHIIKYYVVQALKFFEPFEGYDSDEALISIRDILKNDNAPALLNMKAEESGKHSVLAYKMAEFVNDNLQLVYVYENQRSLVNEQGLPLPIPSRFARFRLNSEIQFFYANDDPNCPDLPTIEQFPDGSTPYDLDRYPYQIVLPDGYVNIKISEAERMVCDKIVDRINAIFDNLIDGWYPVREKLLMVFGEGKGRIQDSWGNISGFIENPKGPGDNLKRLYGFVNEIPGCTIDTAYGITNFSYPDSVDVELFLFGDSLDSAIVNYIHPTDGSGTTLSFLQFEQVPYTESSCAYLVLHDTSMAFVIESDYNCDQVIDEYIAPDTNIVYLYGDANGNGAHNILDITFIIAYLYQNGPAPFPSMLSDANCNGELNILDVTYLIAYIYQGGPQPNCL